MRTGGHALPPPSLCSEISCPVAMEEDQEEVKIESASAVDPPEIPQAPAVMMACDPVWEALLNVYEVHRQELLQAELMRKEMSSDGEVTSKDAASLYPGPAAISAIAASRGVLALPRAQDIPRQSTSKNSRSSFFSDARASDARKRRSQDGEAVMVHQKSSSGFSDKSESDDIEAKEAFPMKDAWLLLNREKSRFYTKENSLSGPMFIKAGLLSVSSDSSTKVTSRRCISPPWSRWRISWDVTGGLLLLHDFVALPIAVFQPPPTPFGFAMEWLSAVFWTLNIVASMTVGFTRNGVTVMDFPEILKNYLRTWCIPDVALVLLDWLSLALPAEQSMDESTEFLRLVRLLRIIRILRLVRMLKLRTLMANFHDLINSEYWSLVANMSQIVTFMLGINHLVACGFYGLTEITQASEETSWVRNFGFEGTSWSYRYATALHWSITQFTPAAMEVHPTNMPERSYSIAVVIFAMVGFSSLVGGITSILTQLRGLSQEKAKELWKLRRYMRLKHVKADLNVRIQRYVEHAWNERQMNLSIGSVKFVELLSEPLRDELLCAVDMPTMVVHPLFSFLQKEQEVTLRRLVTHAIQHKFLARGDIHFYSAEVATHAYFTVSGNQTYTQHPPRVAVAVAVEIDRNQQWVGEQVLWANDWVHLGSFQAVSESDMMALDPAEVAKALSSNPPAWNAVAGYAQEFTMWLNSQHTNELSDILSAEDLSYVFDELKKRNSPITGKEKPPQERVSSGFARRLSAAVMPVINTTT